MQCNVPNLNDFDIYILLRFKILWSRDAESSGKDGLNSLKYDVKFIEKRKLYTWIYVSINQTEVLKVII